MGCFDTVRIICPNCKSPKDIQTKAGRCGMEDYSIENAPLMLKADLSDEPINCHSCGGRFIVRTQAISNVYMYSHEEED